MDKPEPIPGRPCERTFQLEDISIRTGGDGRTVVAYAAVFNTPAEIHDQDGHYMETVAPGAFTKTLTERAGQIQVFYNHAKTIYGTPSERFSLPLGTPEEITADTRGLLTVTRYNKTALADEVLESIRNGDIKGQSFSGSFLPGASKRTRGEGGGLDTIVRSEVALREYGPTPMPSYATAAIVGVRTADLADTLRQLTTEQLAELFAILDTSRNTEGPSPAELEAAIGTSPATDPPEPIHGLGPSPSERRQYVLEFFREVA